MGLLVVEFFYGRREPVTEDEFRAMSEVADAECAIIPPIEEPSFADRWAVEHALASKKEIGHGFHRLSFDLRHSPRDLALALCDGEIPPVKLSEFVAILHEAGYEARPILDVEVLAGEAMRRLLEAVKVVAAKVVAEESK